MDLNSILNKVNSKEKFIEFLTELRYDKEQKSDEWENDEITTYLEGICSWVDDMEGYFQNINMDMPNNIDWKFIAMLFYVGKIYE
ncbi:MAG: hypothetical protein HDQ97_02035 [Lachnospiraceae bacterium]|nr:hypothetical protein [Lachnospiraceae bacterium]